MWSISSYPKAGAASLLVVFLLFSSAAVQAHDPHHHDWPGEPYYETREFVGELGCGVAMKPLGTGDVCTRVREDLGQDMSWYESEFEFLMAAGLSGLVVVLDGQPNVLGLEPWLHLYWQVPVAAIPELRGETPLLATYAFTPDEGFTQQENVAQMAVRPDAETSEPQVMVDTSYRICLGLFYNGAPMPDGFQPCA